MQSTSTSIHVAVIMDGNGRWALRRGLAPLGRTPRGVDADRRVVEAAPELGHRDPDPLRLLLGQLGAARGRRCSPDGAVRAISCDDEAGPLRRTACACRVIGRRDRLPPELLSARSQPPRRAPRGGRACTFEWPSTTPRATRSSTRPAAADETTPPANASRSGSDELHGAPAPDVDLLIRTGGEQRSERLPPVGERVRRARSSPRRMWPDFHGDDLAAAVAEFRGRARRFGALPETASP